MNGVALDSILESAALSSSTLFSLRSIYANTVKSKGQKSPEARLALRAYEAAKVIDRAEYIKSLVTDLPPLLPDERDELIRIFAAASTSVRSNAPADTRDFLPREKALAGRAHGAETPPPAGPRTTTAKVDGEVAAPPLKGRVQQPPSQSTFSVAGQGVSTESKAVAS